MERTGGDRIKKKRNRRKRKGNRTNPAIVEGYERSIRAIYSDIWHQKEMVNCIHVAATHMVTILYRQKHKRYKHLVLSPQALTDNGGKSIFSIQECLINKEYYGLSNIEHQPYLRMPIPHLGLRPSGEKFTISGLKTYGGREEMIEVLLRNFGEGGPAYPLLGSTSTLDVKSEVEYKKIVAMTKDTPFDPARSDEEDEEEDSHVVVIVGIYVISLNPFVLSIEIKNSWGVEWGENGFGWVTINALDAITEPIP